MSEPVVEQPGDVRQVVEHFDLRYEYVHHLPECPSIGGNGDADCRCGAVAFLKSLAVVNDASDKLADIEKLAHVLSLDDAVLHTARGESPAAERLRLFSAIATLRVEVLAAKSQPQLVQMVCDTAASNLARAEKAEADVERLKTGKWFQQLRSLWDEILPREPMCRDCADHDGRCPHSGEPCDPNERAIAIVKRLKASPPAPSGWQPIESAPKDGGQEVLLRVKVRAGIPGGSLVGHWMPGGHCIEDHPPIDGGWYFWNGCMFDLAAEPTHWMPLPPAPGKDGE